MKHGPRYLVQLDATYQGQPIYKSYASYSLRWKVGPYYYFGDDDKLRRVPKKHWPEFAHATSTKGKIVDVLAIR